jgi:carboxyl-terminal processing protease
MSLSRRNLLALGILGSLSVFCWQATLGAKPKDEMLELYGLFVDAVEKVEANYVQPVDRRELLESALEGMLQHLDAHSTYINTNEWNQFRRQIEGRFGGIGIQIDVNDETGRLRVVAPMVGTPAYEAGILAGDQILEIDGQSTEGMNRDKAIEALQGRPGTEVKLTVLHEGSEKAETIAVNRAFIDLPSVLGDRRKSNQQWDFMLDKANKIGYIRITSFIQNTTAELRKALEQLKEEGMQGLILDLRDNPGGLLSAAVDVSDLFLEDGAIVSTKGRNTLPKSYVAHQEGTVDPFPLAVLVNQNSASASEIVSAALQDHKRAQIIGQRTFGKGSVQNILELEGGSSVLKLTVASYFRPSGENIHRFRNAKPSDKWGVTPDKGLEVKLKDGEYVRWFIARRHRDQEANKRIKKDADAKPKLNAEAKDAEAKVPEGAGHPAGDSFVDRPLDKALEVVRGKLNDAAVKKAA